MMRGGGLLNIHNHNQLASRDGHFLNVQNIHIAILTSLANTYRIQRSSIQNQDQFLKKASSSMIGRQVVVRLETIVKTVKALYDDGPFVIVKDDNFVSSALVKVYKPCSHRHIKNHY